MKWTKEMFRALAAVAWADGKMRDSEAVALRRTAKALGLDASALAEVEKMTTMPTSLEGFRAKDLGAEQSEYLYALACLVSVADGHVDLSERACISKLGDLLNLSPSARRTAEAAAETIARQLGLAANVFEALAKDSTRTP
jgi:tellurite resistance protein